MVKDICVFAEIASTVNKRLLLDVQVLDTVGLPPNSAPKNPPFDVKGKLVKSCPNAKQDTDVVAKRFPLTVT